MKQAAINYGQALFESKISDKAVQEAKEIYESSGPLRQVLESPVVDEASRANIIERVFPKEMRGFLKLVCSYHQASWLSDIFQIYERRKREKQGILSATLFYVRMPDETYVRQIEAFLLKKYKGRQVELTLVQDTSLLGGFLLQIGNIQYDCSARGAMGQLRQKLVRR